MKIDGLTLEDVRQIDPRKLDTRTLKALTQKLASAANKRIKRLEKTGLSKQSPAYQFLRGGAKHKGRVQKFTSKTKKARTKAQRKMGKTYERSQLLSEYARASSFLFESKTGSVRGAKASAKAIEERFSGYYDLRKSERRDFWEAYNRLVNSREGALIARKGGEGGVITSSEAQRILYDEMFGDNAMDAGKAIDTLSDMLEEQYQEMMGEEEYEQDENPLELDLGEDDDFLPF